MLWKLFRSLSQTKKVSASLGNRLCSSARISSEPEQADYSHVKLLGTIVTKTQALSNGVQSMVVRTVEKKDTYLNHLVNMRTEQPLTIGDRVYVFGVLSSKPFTLDDGRLRQKLIIKSNYLRLRGHERSVAVRDENNVKILGKITSDIRHTDKYSLFTIAKSYTTKGVGQIPGTIMTEFYSIIVYDQSAFNMDRSTLNRNDRVHIEGKISYMPYRNADGKKIHGGLIVAESVNRAN